VPAAFHAPLVDVQRVAVHVVDGAGEVLAEAWLRHGETVEQTLARAGGRAGRLTSVGSRLHPAPQWGVRLHVLLLEYMLTEDPAGPPGTPDQHGVREIADPDHLRDALTTWADGWRSDPLRGQQGADPIRIQRAGAYAVLHDARGILLTQLFTRRWTLPGGGIHIGESPEGALRREVHEETGFVLDGVRLAHASTARWTGRAPDAVLEDFQAVYLIYTADPPAGDPRVLELDGSTVAAAWVPICEVFDRDLSGAALDGLALLGFRPPP
jgi:8-oxo-dGTP pyrophosphatase MutT (NUDIX family)